jgi:hypothetical protein
MKLAMDFLVSCLSSPSFWVVFGVILGHMMSIKNQNTKTKLESFSKFHDEYSKNIGDIISSYNSVEDEDFNFENKEQRKAVVNYFLKFQSFYLSYKKELISSEDFKYWEEEFDRQMNNKFFVQGWEYLKTQCSFSKDFEQYVDDRIEKHKSALLKTA